MMTMEESGSSLEPEKPKPEIESYASLPSDIMYVYHNRENPAARRRDAPNLGAWGMLRAVKDDDKLWIDFIKNMLPKVLAILEKKGQVDEFEADIQERERRPIAELGKLIDEAVGEAA